MEIRSYIKSLRNMKDVGKELMCTYCGVETLSIGDISICSNCESIIHASRSMLSVRDPELVKMLDGISSSIKGKDFESAITTYESIRKGNEEPALLYAEALAYIDYSNYEISKISYDREGFMEENAVHRSRGSELISTSKLLLANAISLATGEIEKGNVSLNLEYSLFLAQLKLGQIRGASYTLGELRKMTGAYVLEYANMAFGAGTGRYDDAIEHAGNMIRGTQPALNAFYYLAFALFKKNKIIESTVLLKELQKLTSNANVESLLEEIEELHRV